MPKLILWNQFAWPIKVFFCVGVGEGNKKNIVSLSSAELAQGVVKVNFIGYFYPETWTK